MQYQIPIALQWYNERWKRYVERIVESMKDMDYSFVAAIELFERKMGWYYVSVPTALSKPLEYLADRGLIAITAKVGNSSWPTSLLPMGDGTHFIALPAKVRNKEKLSLGMEVKLSFESRTRTS